MILYGTYTTNPQAINELLTFIEFMRKELITVGQHHGLNSKEAITLSQELDHYIAIFQNCYHRENGK